MLPRADTLVEQVKQVTLYRSALQEQVQAKPSDLVIAGPEPATPRAQQQSSDLRVVLSLGPQASRKKCVVNVLNELALQIVERPAKSALEAKRPPGSQSRDEVKTATTSLEGVLPALAGRGAPRETPPGAAQGKAPSSSGAPAGREGIADDDPYQQKCRCTQERTLKNDVGLLCDGCDDEFALCCVGLVEPPTSELWFCPFCTEHSGSTSAGTVATSNKKRRKSKSAVATSPTAITKMCTNCHCIRDFNASHIKDKNYCESTGCRRSHTQWLQKTKPCNVHPPRVVEPDGRQRQRRRTAGPAPAYALTAKTAGPARRARVPRKHGAQVGKQRDTSESYSEEEDAAIIHHVEEWLAENPDAAGATMECWRQFDFTRDFISESRHADGMRSRYAKYLKSKNTHVNFIRRRNAANRVAESVLPALIAPTPTHPAAGRPGRKRKRSSTTSNNANRGDVANGAAVGAAQKTGVTRRNPKRASTDRQPAPAAKSEYVARDNETAIHAAKVLNVPVDVLVWMNSHIPGLKSTSRLLANTVLSAPTAQHLAQHRLELRVAREKQHQQLKQAKQARQTKLAALSQQALVTTGGMHLQHYPLATETRPACVAQPESLVGMILKDLNDLPLEAGSDYLLEALESEIPLAREWVVQQPAASFSPAAADRAPNPGTGATPPWQTGLILDGLTMLPVVDAAAGMETDGLRVVPRFTVPAVPAAAPHQALAATVPSTGEPLTMGVDVLVAHPTPAKHHFTLAALDGLLSPQFWTVATVSRWAEAHNFDYPQLRSNFVNGELLLALDDAMLAEDLGITSKLHRKRFLLAVNNLAMEWSIPSAAI